MILWPIGSGKNIMESEISYKNALAVQPHTEILEFQTFGDKSGDWLAYIKYKTRYFFIHGCFSDIVHHDLLLSNCKNRAEKGLAVTGREYLKNKMKYDIFLFMMKYSLGNQENRQAMLEWTENMIKKYKGK